MVDAQDRSAVVRALWKTRMRRKEAQCASHFAVTMSQNYCEVVDPSSVHQAAARSKSGLSLSVHR